MQPELNQKTREEDEDQLPACSKTVSEKKTVR